MATDAQRQQIMEIARKRALEGLVKRPSIKPPPVKRMQVRLWQNDVGEWMVQAGEGEGFQATDYEVNLWLDLMDVRQRLEASDER